MLLPNTLQDPSLPLALNTKLDELRNSINLINAYKGTSLELKLTIADSELYIRLLVKQGIDIKILSESRMYNERIMLIDWSRKVGKETLQDYVSRFEEQEVRRQIPLRTDWGNTA